MAVRRIVVDGSNLATEGRSLPSLRQLDEAVRELLKEFPEAEVTVVVDASFGHRIEEPERATFEEAEAAGELVSPPAGAVGRGDAFLLRIAERTGATVLSNDSFQEFHGEHEWLFDKDRLLGGKPVPGVGWIFTPRTPVRGPKSRDAQREARRSRVRVGSKEASQPMPVPKVPPPTPTREAPADARTAPVRSKEDPVVKMAIADATAEVVEAEKEKETTGKRATRPRSLSAAPGGAAEPVNPPLPFITFIAAHPLGELVQGEVDSFTSHGAFVAVEGVRAYVPISGLGDPPPRRARDVLSKGETRSFVVQALDAQRRGVELALPGYAQVSGQPTDETVEAEIKVKKTATKARSKTASRRSKSEDRPVPDETPDEGGEPDGDPLLHPEGPPVRRRSRRPPPDKTPDEGGEPGGDPLLHPEGEAPSAEAAAPVKSRGRRRAPRKSSEEERDEEAS